jgi:hypothetical protein
LDASLYWRFNAFVVEAGDGFYNKSIVQSIDGDYTVTKELSRTNICDIYRTGFSLEAAQKVFEGFSFFGSFILFVSGCFPKNDIEDLYSKCIYNTKKDTLWFHSQRLIVEYSFP